MPQEWRRSPKECVPDLRDVRWAPFAWSADPPSAKIRRVTPNPNAPVVQQSWFQRNWKWLLPVGCGLPVLCCGVFGAATIFGASAAMKSSEVYAEALGKALANPEVREALGEPITPGLMPQGSVETKNGKGTAELGIPLSGPKGKGTLSLKATKGSSGTWTFSQLEVEVGAKRIDLMKEAVRPDVMPPGEEELEVDPPDSPDDGTDDVPAKE